MAYAALHSLVYTIKGLLDSSRISVAPSTEESLRSALHHARSLRFTLKECREGIHDMDERIIIEEARKLEDAIEFPLSQSPTFSFNLHQDAMDCFANTAKESEEIIEGIWDQKAAKMIEEDIQELFVQKTAKPSPQDEEEYDDMVGLSDQFLQIRHKLLADTDLQYLRERVVWISGMAGIGKTTLAKKLYDDPLVKTNFQYRVFVRLGQKCLSKERIFQAIIDQVNLDKERMSMEVDEDLGKSFYRIFNVTKSLIVLDDVWYQASFFALMKEDKGSVFLLTSRKDSLCFWNLKMRFMNEEESWELLSRKVFGEEKCPPQLVKAGKKIAEKCEGLPLLINAVAPILLSKAQKDPEYWTRVADKPNSVLEEASHQISQVLLSSYHQISDKSKLQFLCIASFPQNCMVRRSTIINLWFAEGFRYTYAYRVLIEENLVTSHQKSWSETKACSLHCAYWYVSRRVAENNKYLCTINSSAHDLDERLKSHRRLAIYKNVLFAIKEVHNKIASIPTVRSLLCTGPYHQYQVPICWEWKLLRVLHALTIRYYEFPVEVVKLIRLRYLALTCNANLPCSISKLWSLEFLIVRQHSRIKRVATETSYLPLEIWDLRELKHLEIMGRNLPDPRPGAVLPNLKRLLDVGVESCTKGVLESIPELEELRIQIELAPDAAETLSYFDHVSFHDTLKSFQSVIINPTLLRPPPPLSISTSSLRKLSLSGFGYPWEDMSQIAEFPYLRVLKLQCYAFRGEKWEAKGRGFPRLEYLLIEDTDLVQWTAGDEQFRWLQRLTMKNCHKLQEIPLITSVAMENIELVDCNPLAETCTRKRYDAERVTVSAKYSWN